MGGTLCNIYNNYKLQSLRIMYLGLDLNPVGIMIKLEPDSASPTFSNGTKRYLVTFVKAPRKLQREDVFVNIEE